MRIRTEIPIDRLRIPTIETFLCLMRLLRPDLKKYLIILLADERKLKLKSNIN